MRTKWVYSALLSRGQTIISISARHQAARDFAAAGYPVFPCVVGGKQPACTNGYKDATTNLAQIDAWWGTADYNLAICPEMCGWAVVETDGYKEGGLVEWGAKCAENDPALPDTYEVRSPRGGVHHYFIGSLPPTAGKLAKNVDTRGIGSYVLIPPSQTADGIYEVLHDRELATLPGWIADDAGRSLERVASAVGELDTPANVDRARSLLAVEVRRGAIARDGSGGNDSTYVLACQVQNLGISPTLCRELLEELWNPHCEPPWASEELDDLCEHAARYAQNEPGANGVVSATEVWTPQALDKLGLLTPEPAQRTKFYPKDRAEQDLAPDPEWLIPLVLPKRATVVVAGLEKMGKTFIMLDMLLSIGAKVTTAFGCAPLASGPTFYAANEGGGNVGKARRQAWEAARGVSHDYPFYTMPAPNISDPGEVQAFGDAIKWRCGDHNPEMIGLDTYGKIMGASGLDENHAGDASKFVTFLDSLRDAFDCTIAVGAHSGKSEGNSTRGSGALRGGIDTLLEVRKNKDTGLTEVWCVFHRDAEARAYPWVFKPQLIKKALVFNLVTPAEQKDEDPFSNLKVGGALRALASVSEQPSFPTEVLLLELLARPQSEPEDRYQKRLRDAEKTLRHLAKGPLLGYCAGAGRNLIWLRPPDA